jgi:chemotaxis protein CheZ
MTVTGDADAKLQDATTRIYEACSFQDITGQRITKIVATLKTIERKVAHIINTFGPDITHASLHSAEAAITDTDLLNGPQLPENAMDQSDIDKLMASFE